jgi:hypothetical protein
VILLEKLSGAASTSALREILDQQSRDWQASKTYYLSYDEEQQVLLHGGYSYQLHSDSQPGVAALSLRPCADQSLSWPEQLPAGVGDGGFRMSLPILHWGSLLAVLLVSFEAEPDQATREAIEEAVKVLGVMGQSVAEREHTAAFVTRTQELLVHAVEAQGKAGHVGRCSRVASKPCSTTISACWPTPTRTVPPRAAITPPEGPVCWRAIPSLRPSRCWWNPTTSASTEAANRADATFQTFPWKPGFCP